MKKVAFPAERPPLRSPLPPLQSFFQRVGGPLRALEAVAVQLFLGAILGLAALFIFALLFRGRVFVGTIDRFDVKVELFFALGYWGSAVMAVEIGLVEIWRSRLLGLRRLGVLLVTLTFLFLAYTFLLWGGYWWSPGRV